MNIRLVHGDDWNGLYLNDTRVYENHNITIMDLFSTLQHKYKDEKISFVLELSDYRRIKIGKLIIRSIFDRTLFVLGRAIVVAAPCGLLIYLITNINIGTNINFLKLAT